MAGIRANIKTIRELDFSRLQIPCYQRPYRWQIPHVETLLATISENSQKEEYRIGSIILYKENESDKLEIVDGQQRLTTISLLCMCLKPNTRYRLNCQYEHQESRVNIYRNYHYIKDWLAKHNIDRTRFSQFLLDQCTVVEIVADDLSEAFQMFDSQNGRGKELEAYNLLKAYHIHAIDNESSQIDVTTEKKELDRQWEAAVLRKTYGDQQALLKYIVNELYRIRQWSKLQIAGEFNKTRLKEFKGIQFSNNGKMLPLHNQSFLIYLYYQKKFDVANRASTEVEGQNPFLSINMDIINGRVFFHYVQTYVSAYEYLFINPLDSSNQGLCKFRQNFDQYCLEYSGANRRGDTYIREIYVALVIALYDRFGEDYVIKWHPHLYNLAYRRRLEYETVFYSSIKGFVAEHFKTIARAINESDLEPLRIRSLEQVTCNRLGPKEEAVATFMLANGATLYINKGQRIYGSRVLRIGDILTQDDIIKEDENDA